MNFLRVKKFVMDKAYESFEFSVIFVNSHPELYKNPTKVDYEFTKKPDSPILIMKNRDSEGRLIFIYRIKYFKDFDASFFRKLFLTPMFITFNKDTQLNGAVCIIDCRDMNLGSFKKIPMNFIFDGFKISKQGAVKIHKIILIGMPAIMKPILDIGKTFASEKVKNRIHLLHDIDELPEIIDISLLPEDYGGLTGELQDFETLEEGLKLAKLYHKFDVNFAKVQEFEGVGSFRKLEID